MRSLVVFLVLSTASAVAQFGIPTQLPHVTSDAEVRNKVGQYVRLDYQGARLTDQDWPKLKPIVNWTANPEYPLIDVVSRYDIETTATQKGSKWYINVTYHLLGRFNVGQGYSTEPSGSDKQVEFTVENLNGDLKVVNIDPNFPHPSRAAMLKWLENKQASADAATKIIYDQAIKDLSAQSASPFAK